MAFGTRTVAEYDVQFNVNLGKVTSELGAVGETFGRTTAQMSNDALRLSVSQDRLTKAIARSGPESTAAKNALLAYRRELSSLQSTQTSVAASAGRHTSALRGEEQQLERSGRGALAASGIFRGLGRSIAFASGTFLGGYGLVYALESATKAAVDQQEAEGQLETALKNRGEVVDELKGKIQDLTAKNAALGFGELDVTKSLTLAVTATGSLEGATRLLSVAQNVARGRGTDLMDATQLLTRAFAGSGRGLKALGVEVATGVKGWEALDAVQAKYSGRAVAFSRTNAGAFARERAELERTKVTIGNELLPAELHLANAVSNYLGKAKNQEKIQHDVNAVVKTGGTLVHDFGSALHDAETILKPVNDLLGGTERSVKLLGAAFIALKLTSRIRDMQLFGAATKTAGANAEVSAGEYTGLATAEGRATGAGKGSFLSPVLPGAGPFTKAGQIPNTDLRAATTAEGTGILAGKLGIGAAFAEGGLVAVASGLSVYAFGSISDQVPVKIKHTYIDGKDVGPTLPGHEPKPGETATINGLNRVAVYKGDSLYWVVDEQDVSKPGKLGLRGSRTGSKSGPVLNTATGTATPKPLDRRTQIAITLSQAQTAVARGDKGAQQQYLAALKAQIDQDQKDEALQLRLIKTDSKNAKQHAALYQQLQSEEQGDEDTITSIEQAAAAKAKTAADRRAAARKKALEQKKKEQEQRRRDYLAAIKLHETKLDNDLKAAQLTEKTIADDKKALQRLIAFDKAEEHNQKLTAAERASYRAKELLNEKRLEDLGKKKTKAGSGKSDIAQFLSDFASIVQSYAPNEQTISTGKLETHGFNQVHELRQQTRLLKELRQGARFGASSYGLLAAQAVA